MANVLLAIFVILGVIYTANAATTICPKGCITSACSDNKCPSCVSGWYYPDTQEDCTRGCSIAHCSVCSHLDTSKCSTCMEGWEVSNNDNTGCKARPAHCSNWNGATDKHHCSSCKGSADCFDKMCTTVYTISTDNSKCEKCAENCETCNILKGGKCDKCYPGYTRTSSYTCEACAEHCATCHKSGADMCDTCNYGYELSEGKCVKIDCMDTCLCHVADVDRCDKPMPGYRWNHDRSGTRKCAENCHNCDQVAPGFCNGPTVANPSLQSGCKYTYLYDQWTGQCVSSATYTQASAILALVVLLISKLSL